MDGAAFLPPAETEVKMNCTCPKECDCQNPPPDNGGGKDDVYHISNECPMHNLYPRPSPDCPIHNIDTSNAKEP